MKREPRSLPNELVYPLTGGAYRSFRGRGMGKPYKTARQVWLEKELKKEKKLAKRLSARHLSQEGEQKIQKSNAWWENQAVEFRNKLVERATRAEQKVLRELAKSPFVNDFVFQDIIYVKKKSKIIGFYIADFTITSRNLIIEVDGGYHNEVEQAKKDAEREEVLKRLGYTIVRVSNEEILDGSVNILDIIYNGREE